MKNNSIWFDEKSAGRRDFLGPSHGIDFSFSSRNRTLRGLGYQKRYEYQVIRWGDCRRNDLGVSYRLNIVNVKPPSVVDLEIEMKSNILDFKRYMQFPTESYHRYNKFSGRTLGYHAWGGGLYGRVYVVYTANSK